MSIALREVMFRDKEDSERSIRGGKSDSFDTLCSGEVDRLMRRCPDEAMYRMAEYYVQIMGLQADMIFENFIEKSVFELTGICL